MPNVGTHAGHAPLPTLTRSPPPTDPPPQRPPFAGVTVAPTTPHLGSRCTATPPTTSATPSTSAGDGTWPSTTIPITVAVAGSSETSRAYVARGSRAIASWSQTYGITDDATPTPTPAAIAIGSSSAGTAFQPASGVTTTSAASIDAARPSIPLAPATRWLSTM